MIEQTRDEIEYYYDRHPTEEDLMGESRLHAELVHYLMEVLKWLFRDQLCAIYENFNFYQTRNKYEKPLAPDIAIIKGVARWPERSWRVGVHGPAPHVVFEIASEETWKRDLEEKPHLYARMGVQEYFAYDPNQPPVWRNEPYRLCGWLLDKESGLMQKITPGPGGRLWSQQLDSLLVPDGPELRLYDRSWHVRPTEAEAEAEAKRAALRLAKAEAEARRMAMRLAESEAEKARILAERLRSLGIDPDQLV